MTTTKKFGRPIYVDEDDLAGGAVRAIRMTREGSALEGAYEAFASQADLRLAPYETQRRSIVSASVKAWISLTMFWVSVAFILSTFVV